MIEPAGASRIVFGALLVVVALSLASCSDDVSLSGYATEVEEVITESNSTLDAMDEAITGSTSLDDMQQYARDRRELRHALLDDLMAIEPPATVADLHHEAMEAIADLVRAEDALVARVLAASSVEEAANAWDTPEGRAARTADERTIRLCEAAQDTFDRTEAGEEYEDLPWIPDDMKRVIRVALGCRAEDR